MFNNQSRKKILFVITKSNWGGAQRYVYDLATNLPRDKYDIAVVCGGDGVLTTKLKDAKVRVINIHLLQRDVDFFREFKVIRKLIDIFKEEQPDIVHLNSSKVGGLGALAARVAEVERIIFTAHGWAFNEDRNIYFKTLIYIGSWLTALLSHTIITISHKEMLQAAMFPFVRDAKIYMIHIGGNPPAFMEKVDARSYIMEQSGINPAGDTVWLGSIGELHKNKGYVNALNACVTLKKEGINFFYTIIGEGEESKKLLEYIRVNDLEKYIRLAGNIPDPTSGATLLRAFDIFLLPSAKEGFPYVLLEAGLAELPVVATRVGGVPELISDQKSGLLVSPKNSDELSAAIKRIADDYNLRAAFGVRLREKITTSFTLENMVAKIAKVYET